MKGGILRLVKDGVVGRCGETEGCGMKKSGVEIQKAAAFPVKGKKDDRCVKGRMIEMSGRLNCWGAIGSKKKQKRSP